MLDAIRRVHRLTTRERSPRALLRGSAEILVETRSLASAAILLRDGQGLRVEAAAGGGERVRCLAALLADGTLPACVARAAAGETVVIHDPPASCEGCQAARGARAGYETVCLPLRSEGSDFGVLHAVLPPGAAGDEDEVALLSELGSDVALALRSFELEAEVGRAQASLAESERRFRSDFEHAAGGRSISTPDGRIVQVNRALANMLGVAPEALVGRRVEELLHPEDRDWGRALGLRLLAGEATSLRCEIRFLRSDGAVVWADLGTALHRDATGLPVQFTSDAHDVTARKRAQAEKARSEQRHRNLIESLDDLVYSVDVEGTLTYVSPAVARYGFDPQEVLGHRFQEFVHPDDREAVARATEARLREDVGPYEFRVLDREGHPRTVRASGRRTFDGRSLTGLAGVLVDLTAQRETEAQLRAAQKMEAIGRLAGGVAHDFNNLLTVINSYAGLASRGLAEGDPRRADLAEIRKAGDRALALTRQLLAFGRRQMLQPDVVDTAALLAGVERMLARLIGEDIRLTCVPGASGRIRADPGQVEQVLMNLAVNARDAMSDGGTLSIETADVELDGPFVATHVGARAGPFVRFRVTDTGCGMDRTTLDHLFEPFFTTKPPGKGTGLGLATAYGIVKQSGGGIWVDSEPGRGSVFDVYFPRVDDAPSSRPAATLPPRAGRGAGTILFVEDDEAIRSLAGRVLGDEGYEVLLAANGGEAILIAERRGGTIDLVVSDVVMPGMGGRALAERLQTLVQNVPILFTSGYGHDAISRHGVLEPGTLFLPKPFTPEILLARVGEVMRQIR